MLNELQSFAIDVLGYSENDVYTMSEEELYTIVNDDPAKREEYLIYVGCTNLEDGDDEGVLIDEA